MPIRAAAWALLVVGCGPPEDVMCAAACDTLVMECDVVAFPDLASCREGCLYEASRGSAVAGMASCVAEVGCDVHQIVGCARATSAVP